MDDPSDPLIRSIADTALWVAVYRALETERPDAIFRDPFARRLAGPRGEEIASVHEFAEQHSWPFVARTCLFDRFVTEAIDEGADLVLNLAAGLDARPQRLPLPSGLRWVEIDLPDLIAYKTQMIGDAPSACALERLPLDLTNGPERRDAFARLTRGATQPVALAEGLLIYLTEDEVCALARDLAVAGVQRWIVDLASPALLTLMTKTMGDLVTRAGAPYRFAPPDGPHFFQRCGWTATDVRSAYRTAAALNRLPPDLARYAGYPDPPEPWRLPIPWSAVIRLTPTA